MSSFPEAMDEYHMQLARGVVQQAYKGLMEYMLSLRARFETNFPGYAVSGLYAGYMDMTYFAVSPREWKDRKLKAAVVFVHEKCRFEVWLAGYNKQVQTKYWKLIRDADWSEYVCVPALKGADAIIQHVLVEHPDFGHVDVLTSTIEKATMRFIRDVDAFLTVHDRD